MNGGTNHFGVPFNFPEEFITVYRLHSLVPELTYDVVARRSEIGSTALLELIRAQRPRWSVFGHVHQPLAARARVGLTECRNVGHFKETGQPYVLRW